MRLGLAMACLVLATGTARAGNITVEFEGVVTTASGIAGAGTGTLFSGSYSYDDGAAMHVVDADTGRYDFGASYPTSGFSLTLHTAIPTVFSGTPLRDITLDNTAGGDAFAAVATTGAGGDFRLDVTGGTNLLSSLALVVPDLARGNGMVQYTNLGAGFVLFMGSLTSLSAVPEPASLGLLGLGLAALAWRRARG